MTSTRALPIIPALDGLRGIAALMVMVFHFYQGHPFSSGRFSGWLQQLTVLGQTGVDLFFVLSGFLITRILIATRHRHDYWFSFYVRRSFRIFPLYLFALSLYYFVFCPLTEGKVPGFRLQWWYWCYLQNIPATFTGLESSGPGHFWSLAVEEHFYLIWPFVVLAVPPRRMTVVCYIIIGLAFVSRLILLSAGFEVFFFTICRMDALAFGALLAVWEHDKRLPAYKKWLFPATGFCLAIILFTMMIVLGGKGTYANQAVKYLLIAAFYACMVGFISTEESPRLAFLSSKLLTFTGKISYGLYVYHPFVYLLIDDVSEMISLPSALLLTIKIFATFCVASLSYYSIEHLFLNLKDKLTSPIVGMRGDNVAAKGGCYPDGGVSVPHAEPPCAPATAAANLPADG